MQKDQFNLPESYGYHLTSLTVIIKRMMESRLKAFDLTHLQFTILINIYKNNVTTQKEMLKYTYGDEASITRLINRLTSKGYIKRVSCSEDKRKKKIVLTPSGITLSEKIIECAQEVNSELVQGLDKKESNELLRLLQKVHGMLGD